MYAFATNRNYPCRVVGRVSSNKLLKEATAKNSVSDPSFGRKLMENEEKWSSSSINNEMDQLLFTKLLSKTPEEWVYTQTQTK